MGTLISSAFTFNPTAISTANAREWWATENQRLDSDWVSIATTVSAILRSLAGSSSSWCSS